MQAHKNLKRARTLRQHLTDAEKLLWSRLRAKQLSGLKFRRQAPIDTYIADFVCADQLLIIELDGGQHAEQSDYDEKRTRVLVELGYRVLRFWNNDVLGNIDGVLQEISQAVNHNPSP